MDEVKQIVFVLYRGCIASYSVDDIRNGKLEAHLLKYNGSTENLPPVRIEFWNEGRHCGGNTDEQDLIDDLFDAVQRKTSA